MKSKIALDREEISETAKRLFLKDFKRVADEYFEAVDEPNLEITRSEEGFLVCILMKSRRIKNVKRPQ